MTQKATIDEIQKVANKIRKQILGVALEKGGCYSSQACFLAEIVASLYMEIMNLGPSTGNPNQSHSLEFRDRIIWIIQREHITMDVTNQLSLVCLLELLLEDRFFVSCCHYASVIYCALQATGRISEHAMDKFNVDGWNMEVIGAEHILQDSKIQPVH